MTFQGSKAGTEVGLAIFRIEKMAPVPVDVANYGKLYSGDCYLVLNTYKKSDKSSKLDMDLHYWQGKDSSQDERGASAYRAVELDDHLGGVPVQHREVEGHESPLFMSLFPKGITYLDGGVDSAFVKVDRDAYVHRLFHLKGTRNVRSNQVDMTCGSLNQGDVFILDAGMTIYQWNGKSANRQEKFKALELATKIKDAERGGKAKLVFLESDQSGPDAEAFFKLLKGSKADIKGAEEGGDDAAVKAEPASLWRISDASGKLEMTEVGRGKLERSMLDENDVFLLDGGGSVFVWVGKGASKDERAKSMQYGQEYLTTHNKPAWTPLTRLPGGGESPAFKSFFVQFDKEHRPANTEEEKYVAKERKLELGVLLAKQAKAEEKMLDNASGKVAVWRIENLKRVPIEEKYYGQFFSGDSYIVQYKYKNGNRDSYVLYFWQGRDSSADEKTASALLTVELAGELADMPGAQVRVVQNKEPHHFLALFKGKMVVRSGGIPGSGGFAKSDASSSSSSAAAAADAVRLFHIRGTNAIDTRAVEVSGVASSLNSGDCFVLLTPSTAFSWIGSGSNGDEQSLAAKVTKEILAEGRAIKVMKETEESEEFWTALGGKGEYANDKHLQADPVEPRLFQVSGVTGNFCVEELCNFTQDDLAQDSTFILDTVAEVAVWIGNNARAADKDAALAMAIEYVANAPDGRSKETPIFRITAGAEPPTFTSQFLGWSQEKGADFSDPYQKALQKAAGSSSASSSSSSASVASPAAAKPAAVQRVDSSMLASNAAPSGKTYSLAELKAGVPAGVVAAKKELALSDADFQAAFAMDKAAFAKLAGWKQGDLKKKVGIF